MKRYFIFILLILSTKCLFAQKMNSRDKLQGIWELVSVKDWEVPENEHSYEYEVYRNNDHIYLHFESDTLGDYHKSKIGFSSKYLVGVDSVSFDLLSDKDGVVLVEYIESLIDSLGIIHRFALDDGFKDATSYYRCTSYPLCYKKSTIPTPYLLQVHKVGMKDGIDYLQKYFEIRMAKISVMKAVVYDSTFHATKTFFVKNDIVEVKKEESEFYKFEYEPIDGERLNGYIKKRDADLNWNEKNKSSIMKVR